MNFRLEKCKRFTSADMVRYLLSSASLRARMSLRAAAVFALTRALLLPRQVLNANKPILLPACADDLVKLDSCGGRVAFPRFLSRAAAFDNPLPRRSLRSIWPLVAFFAANRNCWAAPPPPPRPPLF